MPSVASSNPSSVSEAFCMLVAPLWCDLGCCSRTVVVIKANLSAFQVRLRSWCSRLMSTSESNSESEWYTARLCSIFKPTLSVGPDRLLTSEPPFFSFFFYFLVHSFLLSKIDFFEAVGVFGDCLLLADNSEWHICMHHMDLPSNEDNCKVKSNASSRFILSMHPATCMPPPSRFVRLPRFTVFRFHEGDPLEPIGPTGNS